MFYEKIRPDVRRADFCIIYSFALSENHHTGDADAHILVLFPFCKLLDGFPKLKGFPDFRLSINVACFSVAAGNEIA